MCSNLFNAQRDGILKYGPNDRLSAPWGGQRALVAIIVGQILLWWEEFCQGD